MPFRCQNITIASNGLRPAVVFFASPGDTTTADVRASPLILNGSRLEFVTVAKITRRRLHVHRLNREHSMLFPRRIFVSTPEDTPLTEGHKALKRSIINKIGEAGYRTEVFNSLQTGSSMAGDKPWSLGHLHAVVSHCVGAVIIGLPRWTAVMHGQTIQFTSELCHLEGGVAYELELPLLVLADEGLRDRGIFKEGEDFFVVCVPRAADELASDSRLLYTIRQMGRQAQTAARCLSWLLWLCQQRGKRG